jgi:hypothetical protein
MAGDRAGGTRRIPTSGTVYFDAAAESLGMANRGTSAAGVPQVGPVFGAEGGPFVRNPAIPP